MGLIFNAILKIPMQFFILLLGVLLFVFYLFYSPPIHFNTNILDSFKSSNKNITKVYEDKHANLFNERKVLLNDYLKTDDEKTKTDLSNKIKDKSIEITNQKLELENLIISSGYKIKNPESDYVFISFILDFLPIGLVGFLIAVIFSAAMSATSAEITALSSITTIDIYKRLINRNLEEVDYINYSKLFSLHWGVISIIFDLTLITSENII